MSGRTAFTLLEICLTILIVVILMTMAIPSISGIIEDRRRRASFEEFDAMVHQVQSLAVTERRTYCLEWQESAIVARPVAPKDEGEKSGITRMDFPKGTECTVLFTASLVKDPGPFWTFWPTGTCEPAQISYKGPTGNWIAAYNPLTVQADFNFNGTQ